MSSLPSLLPQIIFYLFVFSLKLLGRGFIWLFFGLFESHFFQILLNLDLFEILRFSRYHFLVFFVLGVPFFDFWSIIFELRKREIAFRFGLFTHQRLFSQNSELQRRPHWRCPSCEQIMCQNTIYRLILYKLYKKNK